MTAAELSTAAQEGIKVNVAVINNGFLGMVRQWQEFFYERRYAATPLRSPDFVKLAEAHGLIGLRAEKRPEVAEVVKQARAAEGTVLIDFRVEQEDSVYPMVPAGADLDAMIRRGVASVPEKNRKLLTYHDSWAYWAREYGFTVIGAVQASDFSDPSPQEVAALITQIKSEKVPAATSNLP